MLEPLATSIQTKTSAAYDIFLFPVSLMSCSIVVPLEEATDRPSLAKSTATEVEGESRLQQELKAISVQQLYHWSATAFLLLVVQAVSDALHHKFREFPSLSEWCVIFLLLYPLASVVAVHYSPWVRPYAAYLLGMGSLLLTLQVIWHWDRHVTQFKEGVLQDQPFLTGTNAHNGEAPRDRETYGSLYGLAFGSSGLDFLDTATLFVVMFQNCVQSTFLCRLGVRITGAISICQGLLFIGWPLVSQDIYSSWICRIVATGVWTAHLIHSSHMFEAALKKTIRLSEELQRAFERDLKNQKDGAKADSVLNHILKNNMADAINCIEIWCARNKGADGEQLSKASDILFRGMWWCKLREAMLSMVAGRYETVLSATDVRQWAQEFVRGRTVALECPTEVVKMDATACSVVLDNAMTNATRHGCPHDPQVKLAVEVVDQGTDGESACSEDKPCGRPVVLRFEVSNRANAKRPPLKAPWTSDGPSNALANESSRPTLSDGLGLQHISMVVNLCGMKARLWQHECRVFFELRLNTQIAAAPKRGPTPVVAMARPVPMGLTILCLDDSPVARQSLKHMLSTQIPDATVATFGKNLAEVLEFKQAALTAGDVVILDQNLDVPEEKLKGTDIVKELMAKGYKGFACIRSGDSAEADRELSRQSGAHWHVGKELRLRALSEQLMEQYSTFLEQRSDVSDASSTRPPDIATSSANLQRGIATSGTNLPQDIATSSMDLPRANTTTSVALPGRLAELEMEACDTHSASSGLSEKIRSSLSTAMLLPGTDQAQVGAQH